MFDRLKMFYGVRLAFAAAAAAGALTSATNAATISPAYEYTGAGTLTDSRPFTLGFEFSLDNAVTVNALGYNHLNFVSDQEVGIWDTAGNLIVSATVLTTDLQIGHFSYHSIADTLLGAGTYRIGGTYQTGLFPHDLSGVTSAPGYTWLTDYQELGAGLNFPTGNTGGQYGTNGIALVNFSFSSGAVPEPATWAMMILGFGLVGGAMRTRVRQSVRLHFG